VKHPDDPRIPPPQMTSAPYTADRLVEPTTGEHESIATTGYVKRKVETVAQRLDDEAGYIDKVLVKVKALGALLVASVGLTASVLVGLDVRAQSKVDAGVVPIVEAQKKLDARVGALEHGQQRAELTAMRQTVMLEQLTEKARLPVPPPALLPDGGR